MPTEPLDLYDTAGQPQPGGNGGAQVARPHIGIFFECCGIYARIYRQKREQTYSGRCPKCLALVRLRVGAGGTTQRIFRAH